MSLNDSESVVITLTGLAQAWGDEDVPAYGMLLTTAPEACMPALVSRAAQAGFSYARIDISFVEKDE